MTTLYMGADKDTVAKYVLFSGDPWRVEVVKKYLDEPKKVAFMREFNTYTGTYKGVEVTVTSTGIGAPSAAIAMEEMYEAGKMCIRDRDTTERRTSAGADCTMERRSGPRGISL